MQAFQLYFQGFCIDVANSCLLLQGQPIPLTPKQFGVLQHLARNAGRVVPKEELLATCWPETHVKDGIVKTCIAAVRRVLGDNGGDPQFIETIPRQGYRFTAPVASGSFPSSLTTFVGREAELGEIQDMLTRERCVTLLGPPGNGKTRLAMQLVTDQLPAPARSMRWLDLAAVRDPMLLEQTVALILASGTGNRLSAAEAIVRTLSSHASLLVLDNCEHLLDTCAALADHWLRMCPDLKILATSRAPLGIGAEAIFQVPTLSQPPVDAEPIDVMAWESTRLFTERASATNPRFVGAAHAHAIADICRRLEGLPLAIELTAIHVRMLTPEEIAPKLDNALRLLATGYRTTDPRHQSLRAAIEWSHGLLSEKERAFFDGLSIFAGSFTLNAAEAIYKEDGMRRDDVLQLLECLVNNSLVIAESDVASRKTRYRLLEPLRQFSRSRLAPDARVRLGRRHSEFFCELAEEVASDLDKGSDSSPRIQAELSNLLLAFEFCCVDPKSYLTRMRLATALQRGQSVESLLTVAHAAPPKSKANALLGAGILSLLEGNYEAANDLLEESLTFWRSTDEQAEAETGFGETLLVLSFLNWKRGKRTTAVTLIDQAISTFRGHGGIHLARALIMAADFARTLGRTTVAVDYCDEAMVVLEATGEPLAIRNALYERARIALALGDCDTAEAYCQQNLRLLSAPPTRYFTAWTYDLMAQIACARRDFARAARLFGASTPWAGNPHSRIDDIEYARCVEAVRSNLGPAVAERLWAEGLTNLNNTV